MKNTIKNTKKGILMVALLATITGFANEANDLIKKDSRKTALVLENVKEGNLLSLKDSNGTILYKELIKTNGLYKKGFDFTRLPDGAYFFQIDKDLKVTIIPFTVKVNKATFNEHEEVTIFKPYVRQDKDFVYITKLAPDSEALKITVYSNYNGELESLHTETVENTQIIQKAFKFKKGSYMIVINSDNKEYTTFINN